MEESSASSDLISGAVKRRKITIILILVLGISATVLLSIFLPPSYKSTSTILIEQQEIPTNLVQSTVTSFAAQRIEVITQRVMTRVNLWQIVEKYDLYVSDRDTETRKQIIDQMREDIGREIISAEVIDPITKRATDAVIAFQLSYESENPSLAQKVANELTTLYLSENLKNRSESAEDASRFLSDETVRLERQLAQVSDQLASFKEQNFDALPELRDVNLRQLDRAEIELRENKLALERVNERIIFLEAELAQTDPEAPFLQDSSGLGLSGSARLKLLKSQYDASRASYTENHPTVIRLKSEIAALMEEVDDDAAPQIKLEVLQRQLREAKTKYSDKHPSVTKLAERVRKLEDLVSDLGPRGNVSDSADNPIYVNLKSQLDAVNLEKASIDKRQIQLEKDLAALEQVQKEAPVVEQRYLELTRQYQALSTEYAQASRRQELAELGRSLETEQKGERFTLIEPALLPEEPDSPNRILLLVGGIVFTLVAAVLIAVLRESMDKSIRGRQAVFLAFGAMPLASIPVMYSGSDLSEARKKLIIALAVCFSLLAALLLTIHVMFQPLDVLWFVALRRLGFI